MSSAANPGFAPPCMANVLTLNGVGAFGGGAAIDIQVWPISSHLFGEPHAVGHEQHHAVFSDQVGNTRHGFTHVIGLRGD